MTVMGRVGQGVRALEGPGTARPHREAAVVSLSDPSQTITSTTNKIKGQCKAANWRCFIYRCEKLVHVIYDLVTTNFVQISHL